MAIRRDSNCPLCGAQLTAAELLDTCTDVINSELGVLEAQCPHCQGSLEVMPTNGWVAIGFLIGARKERFDVALSLFFAGLVVRHEEHSPRMTLKAPGQTWEFTA